MSLQYQPVGPIPEDTARVARAAFPKGTMAIRVRDILGAIYCDQQFVDLFPSHGQPAETPWRLALITVLQFAEGLSDRQAADAVRGRIDWKYALGLELTDAGFDFSVLSEFRTRLVVEGAEQRLLTTMLDLMQEQGLLKARGRQRTDATHVLAAIRTLNRLMCVGETLRHALNVLAQVAPDWLRAQVSPEWFDRYSRRFEESRLPTAKAARAALAAVIGADGRQLLAAVYAPSAPTDVRELPAVDILRQVWLQQYYAPDQDGQVRWREADDVPPAALLIHSPYDVEARYSTKRSTTWVGYKVHVTETCDEDTPHLIAHIETTAATTHDSQVTPTIHTALADKDLLPREHLVDASYSDAELLVTSQRTYAVELYGPVMPDTSWQARAGQGFDVACFAVDWDACRVTCPQGQDSTQWKPTHDASGGAVIHVEFERRTCAVCPCRTQCTRSQSGGRELALRPHDHHRALQAARQRQTTAAFKEHYAARAGVEGTLSQGIRAFELRQTRYIGLARTRLQHIITAAAINVHRLEDWWTASPRARTRRSPFVALAA